MSCFNRWVFSEDQPSAINRNLQFEQKPCYLGGPGSDGEKGVLSHTLQQNYYTGWVRGWGNKDDVGDVWANLFPTPLFFLKRVRETRRTKDGNSRRHKVWYFRFETRHKLSTGAKKENIKYQKVKKRLFRPVDGCFANQNIGQIHLNSTIETIWLFFRFILSQSPVRKDQFTVFVHQYINSASIPTQPIWPIYGIPLKGVGINEVAVCFPKIRFVSFFNII